MNIRDIKKKASPIAKRFGAKRLALFGSATRGSLRATSDIDLLIDIPKRMSLFDVVDLKLQFEDRLKRKVDLVEFNSIKPRLREGILKEHVVLYDKRSGRLSR